MNFRMPAHCQLLSQLSRLFIIENMTNTTTSNLRPDHRVAIRESESRRLKKLKLQILQGLWLSHIVFALRIAEEPTGSKNRRRGKLQQTYGCTRGEMMPEERPERAYKRRQSYIMFLFCYCRELWSGEHPERGSKTRR